MTSYGKTHKRGRKNGRGSNGGRKRGGRIPVKGCTTGRGEVGKKRGGEKKKKPGRLHKKRKNGTR